jgi:hypothetical protein
MLGQFLSLTEDLPLRNKLLQISFDGPNVNLNFFELLQKHLANDDPTNQTMLDLGSCGLHTIHNAFKTGAESTGWNIEVSLKAFWHFFKDTPARRADFSNITGCNTYPLKFCSHRWVEDEAVALRAIEIWPYLKKFVQMKEKEKPILSSQCFLTLKNCCSDKFLEAKLHFFSSVAKELKTFLTKYQSDEPMIPFMSNDLFEILKSLGNRYLKKSVMESLTSPFSFLSFQPKDKANHKDACYVDIGFAAKQKTSDAIASKLVNDQELFSFRLQCISFLSNVMEKIINKSPLKRKIVRDLSSLNPSQPSATKFWMHLLIVIGLQQNNVMK